MGSTRSEADLGRVRLTGDVERERVLEHPLVAVARVVPHHDLLTGGDLLAGDFGVFGGRAPEVDHRSAPTDDLLHRALGMGVEVVVQQVALVGEFGEGLHPVADRVAGGLVAGHHQQDEERTELLRRQLFAVDLGGHHDRGDVVPRVRLAVLAERLGVHEHLERLAHQVVEARRELGVAGAQDRVRPPEHPCVVLGRDAHHVADDLQRQGRRDVFDEVARLVGEVVEQTVDHLVGLGANRVLDGSDLPGREALRHDRPQPEMTRIVHVDHRAEELVHLLGLVTDVGAHARTEQLSVAADVPDVVVAGQCPVTVAHRERQVGDLPLVEMHQPRGVAQRLEGSFPKRAGRRPEVRVGEVEVVEADLFRRHGGRHGIDCTRRCGAVVYPTDRHVELRSVPIRR